MAIAMHRLRRLFWLLALVAAATHAQSFNERHARALDARPDRLQQDGQTQPARTPTPQQWMREQQDAARVSEQLLDQAEHLHGLLPQYLFLRERHDSDSGRAFRAIFGQYLGWYQTFVGDYPGAERSFSIAQPLQPDDAPSPLAAPGVWRARPAPDSIARLAEGRRAVFFNESHNAPLTRTLTVRLLARLRAEGYDTFAAETLYHADSAAQMQRGYPVAASGFYTREPIYAYMVRQALTLGYRVIAYEAESDAKGDAREREQAENLYRRAFSGHPDARLVVNAGYAHIQKQGEYLGGRSMVEHFMRISGIDPLCVEQTMLYGRLDPADDHPYWTAVMQAQTPTQPIVFENAQGRPWSLRRGQYDLSVFFPPQHLVGGRPTWLALGSMRRPYPVSAQEYCRNDLPCLLEARAMNDPHAAVPFDRVLLTAQQPVSALWLPPGRYRLSVRDRDDALLRRSHIRVDRIAPAPAASTRKTAPGALPGVD